MDASPGGAESAEILDMDSGEEEDSSSTCTEEDNNHVSKLNANVLVHYNSVATTYLITGGAIKNNNTPTTTAAAILEHDLKLRRLFLDLIFFHFESFIVKLI